jgi:hypothetical protein
VALSAAATLNFVVARQRLGLDISIWGSLRAGKPSGPRASL